MDAGIEDGFAAAGPTEAELRAPDALVVAAAPGIDRQLVPVGSGRMLGYGLMPYRPRSARETTTWPLIALAAQKRHLSLYVCAVVDRSEEHTSELQSRQYLVCRLLLENKQYILHYFIIH